MRRSWTYEKVLEESKAIADSLGHFPSNHTLKEMGRGDLANQICRNGGFVHVSAALGIPREPSDSDTGWLGEAQVFERLVSIGHTCCGSRGVQSPYDLLVDDSVRVDVKAARYAEYGACKGWFYRIGKYVQSDIVILHQIDTKVDYVFYWWEVNQSNMTISRDGGKYANSMGAYGKISQHRDAILLVRQPPLTVN